MTVTVRDEGMTGRGRKEGKRRRGVGARKGSAGVLPLDSGN